MTLEQRVTANEQTIAQLMSLQKTTLDLIREIKQTQVDQQNSIVETRREMVEMRQEMVAMRRDMAEMRQEYIELIGEMRREHNEQMDAMRRFNAGTRKLWVAIARNVEWLDEDDWPEDQV